MEFLRRRLGLIFRTLVSVLLIGWLIEEVNWRQLGDIARKMEASWLVASFFALLPVLLIVSWRWRLLLSVHGVHMRFWRVFELTMIGQFFSAFLVGTTGGDVIKIFYVARAVPHRRAAVAFTVVVDRIIGLVALLLLGVMLSFTQIPLLFSQPATKAASGTFYLFAVAGVAGSVLACFGPYLLQNEKIRSLINRLPLIHRGTSLIAAYEQTARAIGVNMLALLGSIPSQISVILMGYCILRAMHLEPGLVQQAWFLLAFASIMAMVNMLIALPVSIAGLGVRETLFIKFFALLGIDKEHALAFSLTYFGLNLLWSLLAGPFYFLYRHETHAPAPHIAEGDPILSEQ